LRVPGAQVASEMKSNKGLENAPATMYNCFIKPSTYEDQ